MYQAELRGKLSRSNKNKEDILTSNVFSFFKYAPHDIFLKDFLSELQLEVSPEDLEKAEFYFWPTFEDNTEPDLVLIVGKYYLVIEAKLFSGFSAGNKDLAAQLVREVKGGSQEAANLGKEFILLAVTADYSFNKVEFESIKDLPKKHFRWINWQKIGLIIYQILEEDMQLPVETKAFAYDLYDLFQKKNLRKFEGISALIIRQEMRHHSRNLFFDYESAEYRGSFLGFEQLVTTDVIEHYQDKPIFFRDKL